LGSCFGKEENLLSVIYLTLVKSLWYVLLLLILYINCPATGATGSGDSGSSGLGGAGVMLSEEMYFLSNPAALAALHNACLGIVAVSPFLIRELTEGLVFSYLPSKTGTFGFSFSTFGNQAYRETQTCFSFGKSVGKRIRAGIRMEYRRVKQYSDFGNLHAFIPAIGIQLLPVPHLTFGFQISNPAGQGYFPGGFKLIPVVFRAGTGFSAGKEILICFEYEKESGCRPVYCGGMEYTCSDILTLRFGLSSSCLHQYAFGLGFRKDHLRIQLTAAHHQVLGYSPSILLAYSL